MPRRGVQVPVCGRRWRAGCRRRGRDGGRRPTRRRWRRRWRCAVAWAGRRLRHSWRARIRTAPAAASMARARGGRGRGRWVRFQLQLARAPSALADSAAPPLSLFTPSLPSPEMRAAAGGGGRCGAVRRSSCGGHGGAEEHAVGGGRGGCGGARWRPRRCLGGWRRIQWRRGRICRIPAILQRRRTRAPPRPQPRAAPLNCCGWVAAEACAAGGRWPAVARRAGFFLTIFFLPSIYYWMVTVYRDDVA
uniref:Uncharacterized protein n=1 Tax=Arundo donax TaxID=35708 RepID=A0A0A9CSF7_ARUDO